MFWLRNKKNHFQVRTFIWGPEEPVIVDEQRICLNAIEILHNIYIFEASL